MPSFQLARPQAPVRSEPDADVVRDVGVLYRRHADEVARWAARLGGQALDIEDVVHQVFLVAQRRLPEFRGDAKVTTWLHGITVRVVQETRRRQKRWWRKPLTPPAAAAADEEALFVAADQPTALELLEKKEASRLVYALLDQLDEKYRTVLVLFELEGLSGQEIAAITKTSLSNVWVRLLRGRQQFVKRFTAWESASQHKGRARRSLP
jgi:RNA polymerase sigma-70 factor (ECF subfamily)